jgi:hypothetical protein
MILRKINAISSLITTILLLGHAISISTWMLSKGKIIPFGGHALPIVLVLAAVAHAIISIILMISAHKGGKKIKGRNYPKLNAPTMVQRISGILLIVFTWMHIAGAFDIITPPQIVHIVVPPLFFILVMCHIAISFSKAFITLGIGNATSVKFINVGIRVVCIATVIADIIGFYLHVC